jgi:serine/threonine protein kinase
MGFGRWHDEADWLVVEEIAPLGDFQRVIEARLKGHFPPGVNATTCSKVIFGVAATMSQLHARHILHRALTPGHVLLSARGEPLLTGFRCSRFEPESDDMASETDYRHFIEHPSGGLHFMAPEIYAAESYTDKVDVFSFAVFLYSIFAQSFTFASGRGRTAKEPLTHFAKGERFVRPRVMPDTFWDLICDCWHQEPDRRPSFAEITQRMMDCDDFTIDGTDLKEYHRFRTRIVRETANAPRVDPSPILEQLKTLGIDVASIKALHS